MFRYTKLTLLREVGLWASPWCSSRRSTSW